MKQMDRVSVLYDIITRYVYSRDMEAVPEKICFILSWIKT